MRLGRDGIKISSRSAAGQGRDHGRRKSLASGLLTFPRFPAPPGARPRTLSLRGGPYGSREGLRGRGWPARGKWRRRRTGPEGAAGWRWMLQVTGPAEAAPGDALRHAPSPLWAPGRRREGGTPAPLLGITCGRDVCLQPRVPREERGARTHPPCFSSTLSSPQRDGLRSDGECFGRSSSPGHSQHLRPLDSHALAGGAACAG